MATLFSDIYERAIFRFADSTILQKDIETRDDILENYLISARVDFQRICKVDLKDFDRDEKKFNVDLDDEIIEILAAGIAYYWISFKTLNAELLKNNINSKDYYYHSPANLLKEVQTLRMTLRNEFYGRMRAYSYYGSGIENMKP